MDRRKHKRFDLSAQMTYSWLEAGALRNGLGTTRDLSECGLYVLADSVPAPGTAIRFEVSFSFGDDSEIRMRARGKVLRVESEHDKTLGRGFAVATKRVWFGKTKPLSEGEFLKLS